MKNVNAGRPSAGKKSIQIDDLKKRMIRVSTDIEPGTYKNIKKRTADEEKKMMVLLREILEKEFGV